MKNSQILLRMVTLVMVLVISSFGVPANIWQIADLVLHPQLKTLIKTAQPLTQVDVIVQTRSELVSNKVKDEVKRLGGKLTLDLSIIHGFAAVLPVRSLRAVAALPEVKWISPDGDVYLSDTSVIDKNTYNVYFPLLSTKGKPADVTPTPTITATSTPIVTATPLPDVILPEPVIIRDTATPTATLPTPLSRSFYRAINLGGSALTIDGQNWEGENANDVTWSSEKYAQAGGMVQNASASMEAMLRDGVRDSKGNTRVNVKNMPYGVYDVVLYSWEYGAAQAFNIDIEGRLAQANVRNSPEGAWQKLGPFRILIIDGELNINSSGGYAHFAGLEIWKVDLEEDPSPIANCYSLPRTGWAATSSAPNSLPLNAIDADLKTKWSVSSQISGTWFQIDLGALRPFDTIEFDSGKYPAQDYQFQVANVDADWTQQPIIANGKGGGVTTIAARPRNARYLRLTLTSSAPTANWSIYDFGVFDCAALKSVNRSQNAFSDAIGLTRLRQALPLLQGQGVGVAILDSGVNDTSDLTTMLGTNRVLVSVRANDDVNQTPDDGYGHGNHIAGIIGGNGSASQGRYVGVAPGVSLINVKVSNDDGSGRTSRIVAGMQWILQNRERYNIRVVNFSINSGEYESYQNNPLTAAAEILWFNKIVVVVSAGNKGNGNLYPPANDPFVITVGAVDDKGTGEINDDTIPAFSAYGVTAEGIAKPDLVAPGVNIIGLRTNQNSRLSQLHPDHNVSDYYFRMSGTSMAAPMVAAAAALLLQNEPELTPDQVKFRLLKTARAFGNPAQTGAGYLDVYAALNTRTNESANVGLMPSRLLSTGDQPVNSSVSWNSVSWNSVSWNSVSWNSVSWNSVSWNSDHWDSP